jgi:hypothetical protein
MSRPDYFVLTELLLETLPEGERKHVRVSKPGTHMPTIHGKTWSLLDVAVATYIHDEELVWFRVDLRGYADQLEGTIVCSNVGTLRLVLNALNVTWDWAGTMAMDLAREREKKDRRNEQRRARQRLKKETK